jgi:tripartite ATP-independent transporter DctP family solute receptor
MKPRLSVVGATLAALLALASADAQPATLRIAGTFVAAHTSSQAMEIFKAEVARLSEGSVEVELNPGVVGDGVREVLDSVRTRNIFGAWIGVANVSRLVPEVGAINLPFVFENYDQVMQAVDGPVGKLIEAKLGAKGFTALGWMELGARNVTNSRRPLRKLRMQPSEIFLATFRALGSNPLVLDLKDLYGALRRRDIDGQENPYSVIHDNGFFETQPYLSDTGHVLDLIIFIANKQAFMELTPEQQKAIREAAAIAVAQQRKMATAAEAAALVKLKEKGMQFDPVPREMRVAMRRATAGVIVDARKQFGAELVERILVAGKRVADGRDKRTIGVGRANPDHPGSTAR